MSNNKQSGDVLINIDEASKITNYSVSTLYQKVSKNQIPYIKKTGEKRLWFDKEELKKYRRKPSQNKKNKVKIEMRDSEKLTYTQKVIIMLAMLEQFKTSPILKPFRTTNLDYGTMKQNQTIKKMSNNKQSMKLYTEEEIVNFLKKEFADEIDAETFMENLTPIEIPSDEGIYKKNLYSSKEYGGESMVNHTFNCICKIFRWKTRIAYRMVN